MIKKILVASIISMTATAYADDNMCQLMYTGIRTATGQLERCIQSIDHPEISDNGTCLLFDEPLNASLAMRRLMLQSRTPREIQACDNANRDAEKKFMALQPRMNEVMARIKKIMDKHVEDKRKQEIDEESLYAKEQAIKEAKVEKERELRKKKEEDIMVDNCVKSHITNFNCESIRSNFKKNDSKDGVSVRKTINP